MASYDFYRECIAAVLNVPAAQVSDEQRERAKKLCFATSYGARPSQPSSHQDKFNQCCDILRSARGWQ